MRTIRTLLAAVVSSSLATAFVGTAAAQGAPEAQPAAPAERQLPPVAAGAKPTDPAPLAPTAKPVHASNDDADDEDDRDDKKGDDDEDAPKKRSHKKQGDRVRFRGGVSAYGGAYVLQGFAIPYGGVEGRLGVQIKDWIAVYAEPAFLIGASGAGGVVRASVGVIPEFTVADLWFIGLGPEAYAAAGIGLKNCTSTFVSCDTLGFASASDVGLNGRTGFAFGSVRPGRRKMFTLAFDGRLDFYGGHPAFAPALSLGYDAM